MPTTASSTPPDHFRSRIRSPPTVSDESDEELNDFDWRVIQTKISTSTRRAGPTKKSKHLFGGRRMDYSGEFECAICGETFA
jgi:hypothetical protein